MAARRSGPGASSSAMLSSSTERVPPATRAAVVPW
jgi:hypothetical protein